MLSGLFMQQMSKLMIEDGVPAEGLQGLLQSPEFISSVPTEETANTL